MADVRDFELNERRLRGGNKGLLHRLGEGEV